jgi:phospholipid/cholesterol/gamma-HCH transport system substrate-binding protein
MISERPRNFIVGLTFLLALAVCMYGIIFLGKFPSFGAIRQYTVTLSTPNANGVNSGSKVEFNGVYAGQVESTWLASDNQGRAVVFVRINIDPKIDLPASATASMERPTAVGNPYVALSAAEFKPPFLPRDGSATLDATAAESSLIPKEVFADVHALKTELTLLSQNLSKVATDLHVLLDYTPPEAVANANPNDPNRPRENISTVVVRLDRTVASLQTLLTDPKLQGQVRDAVQNISDAAGQLKTTLAKFDKTLDDAGGALTSFNTAATSIGSAAASFGGTATQATAAIQGIQKDADKVAQQIVETVAQLDKSIRQITEGKGTTGQLVNDPRLYEGLIDLSKSLKTTVSDLDFLINKWKDEGVNLNLK